MPTVEVRPHLLCVFLHGVHGDDDFFELITDAVVDLGLDVPGWCIRLVVVRLADELAGRGAVCSGLHMATAHQTPPHDCIAAKMALPLARIAAPMKMQRMTIASAAMAIERGLGLSVMMRDLRAERG